jgi:hypothetical protein
MSSPVLNSTEFVLVADQFHALDANSRPADSCSMDQIEHDDGSLLTGRTIAAVMVLGAAFWYVLWRVALHFWMMR